MTSIVMVCRDRYRLLKQSLDSLKAHTERSSYTLTLIDDSSYDFRVKALLAKTAEENSNVTLLTILKSDHVVGRAKNIGVAWSKECFGEGDWLYFSDSDVYFTEGWLEKLAEIATDTEPLQFGLWGGQVHPFHAPIPSGSVGIGETDNDYGEVQTLHVGHVIPVTTKSGLNEYEILDGPSWLLRWPTWNLIGPWDRNTAPGVCQSDEYPVCKRLREWQGRIGVIYPHVVVHTGLTQTDGKDAPGWKERKAMIPKGVLAE